MTITAKCPECEEVVKPSVFNHRACEAQCPECGEWFCYSDTSGRAGKVKHDGGTEQCKREYDGKTNSRW